MLMWMCKNTSIKKLLSQILCMTLGRFELAARLQNRLAELQCPCFAGHYSWIISSNWLTIHISNRTISPCGPDPFSLSLMLLVLVCLLKCLTKYLAAEAWSGLKWETKHGQASLQRARDFLLTRFLQCRPASFPSQGLLVRGISFFNPLVLTVLFQAL